MKKLFVMLVMLFTMNAFTFAEDAETSKVANIERYDLKINLRALSRFLDLNADQMDGVECVEHEFHNDLMIAAVEGDEVRRNDFTNKIINKHIKHMGYILNAEQFKKYVIVLNASIRNREIVK